MDDVNKNVRHDDYARQMTRRWNVGEVYAPHDLSPSEMAKWRRNQARKKDLVDMLGLRPLDMYRVSEQSIIMVFFFGVPALALSSFYFFDLRITGNKKKGEMAKGRFDIF